MPELIALAETAGIISSLFVSGKVMALDVYLEVVPSSFMQIRKLIRSGNRCHIRLFRRRRQHCEISRKDLSRPGRATMGERLQPMP
jgi:hypothetical protein